MAANTRSYIKLKKADLGLAGFVNRHIALKSRINNRSRIESRRCYSAQGIFLLLPCSYRRLQPNAHRLFVNHARRGAEDVSPSCILLTVASRPVPVARVFFSPSPVFSALFLLLSSSLYLL
jgi:hypothetical protein